METVGERIKAFRDSRGLTQKDIFQATNGEIKQTSLSAIENNQAKPGFDTLAALLAAYPTLSSDWLLRGAGPMLADGDLPALSRPAAHGRAHGEARTAVHPTVQPADKELAAGTNVGPYLHDEDPVVQQLLIRIAEKDRIIERQQEDIEAWRDAFRKPLASAEAATAAMSIRRWQGAYAATATDAAPECRMLQFKSAA